MQEDLYILDKSETNLTVSTEEEDIDFINKICGNSPIEIKGNECLINFLNKKNIEYEILKNSSLKVINIIDDLIHKPGGDPTE